MADEGGVFFDLLLPLDAKELDLRPASEGVEGLKIENEKWINTQTYVCSDVPCTFNCDCEKCWSHERDRVSVSFLVP